MDGNKSRGKEVEIEETLKKIKEDLLAQQKIIADLKSHQQNYKSSRIF